MKFVRYGSLQPHKQIRYGMDTFHAPPCKKGFYAFPFKYVEFFLLGATSEPSNSSGKSQWLKDENGNLIKDEDLWDIDSYDTKTGRFDVNKKYKKLIKKKKIKTSRLRSTEKNGINYVTVLKQPKEFEYDGELWHHLEEGLNGKQELIIDCHGSWIKTDMKTYEQCLKRVAHIQYSDSYNVWGSIRNKDGLKAYSKDHLEVFFEKVK